MNGHQDEVGSTLEPKGHSPAWLALAAATSLLLLVILTIHALSAAFDMRPMTDEESAVPSASATHFVPVDSIAPSASSPIQCVPRVAQIVNTGNFDVAKLRISAGFEAVQDGYVAAGSWVIVCESRFTSGREKPNQWFQISEGKHGGRWVHADVLRFTE